MKRKIVVLALVGAALASIVGGISPAAALSPAPEITFPANAGGYQLNAFNVEGTGVPGSTVELILGDPPCANNDCFANPVLASGPVDAFGLWSIPVNLLDGQHRLYARQGMPPPALTPQDTLYDVVDFYLDTIPPAPPTIDTPVEGDVFFTKNVFLSGTAEPFAHVVTIDEAGLIRATTAKADGTWSFPGIFIDGLHTLDAYQEDLAFNASALYSTVALGGVVDFEVDVDVTPPPAPIIISPAEGALLPAEITIAGTAEPGSSVEVLEDRPAGFIIYGTVPADPITGAWSLGPITMLDGLHFIQARATDAAGNLGPRSDVRSFRIDATKPRATVTLNDLYMGADPYFNGDAITGTGKDNVAVASITVTVSDFTGTVDSSLATCTGCGSPCVDAVMTCVTWEYVPPTLAPGLYFVDVVATDMVGNESDVASKQILAIA